MMKSKEEVKIPLWLYLIGSILWIPAVVTYPSFGIIIGAGVTLYCGSKCYEWAHELKNNKILAFFIGFIFGLFGLLGYWIYYKAKKK